MVSLMQRRREMMRAAGEVNHLLFSVENRVVTAGDRINTGVKPLASDFDLTILLDITTTANPTSGTSRLWKLICVYNNTAGVVGLQIGKHAANNQSLSAYWQSNTNTTITGGTVTVGRHRIAVTHEAGSNVITVVYRKDTGTRRTQTFTTETFQPANDNILYFGRQENGDNSLPPGTIHSAKVYDIILGSADINAFFA